MVSNRSSSLQISNLLALQKKFQQYLLDNNFSITKAIVHTKQINASERLGIYQNAYIARLIEALANNYPILHTFIGEELFNQLAKYYLERYPSTQPSIRWFGEHLANFLNAENNFLSPPLNAPYLRELAEFEWKLSLAFDSLEEGNLSMQTMASFAPEVWPFLYFIPHVSVQEAYFSWNIVPLWKALNNNQAPPRLKKSKKISHWIIWRKDHQCHFYSLSSEESCAWNAMKNGENFATICSSLNEYFEARALSKDSTEISLFAASLLKSWIESGLLSKAFVSKSRSFQ